MAHIVLAWELGGGFGHITRIHQLAELLIAAKHQVSLIIPEPSIMDKFGDNAVSEYASIHPTPKAKKRSLKLSRDTDNFSEILLTQLYYDPSLLEETIKQWRVLFEELHPDLICFESAPTAILATRGLSVKTLKFGQPFFIPPDHIPFPSFTSNRRISNATLKQSDDRLLKNIKTALKDNTELSIYDYLNTDETLIASVAEADFYAPFRKDHSQYIGSFNSGSFGKKSLSWSNQTNKMRLFCYLKPDYSCLKEFITVLAEQDFEARIFIAGVDEHYINNELKSLDKNTNIELSCEPYTIDESLSKADLIVCHSGGSITYSVTFGIPLLAIPLQREQMMSAQRCIDSGIATGLNPKENNIKTIHSAIKRGLDELRLKKNALSLKRKYQSTQNNNVQNKIMAKIEALLP